MAIQPVNLDLCNGCGICVRICPTDVFRMVPETNKAVVRYPEDCMLCGFCELDCPEGALTITPEKHSRLIVSWG
jgi:NAD-dependent dihydropyrimidine dehydrogenase PreA subunit